MESGTRARVIYFMQTGYNDAVIKEDMKNRLMLVPDYVRIFTGKDASQEELDAFTAYVVSVSAWMTETVSDMVSDMVREMMRDMVNMKASRVFKRYMLFWRYLVIASLYYIHMISLLDG